MVTVMLEGHIANFCNKIYLANEAEADPEDDIANGRTRKAPRDLFRQEDKRKLPHHGEEAVGAYHVAGHANEHFVQNGRKEEDDESGTSFGETDPH